MDIVDKTVKMDQMGDLILTSQQADLGMVGQGFLLWSTLNIYYLTNVSICATKICQLYKYV